MRYRRVEGLLGLEGEEVGGLEGFLGLRAPAEGRYTLHYPEKEKHLFFFNFFQQKLKKRGGCK